MIEKMIRCGELDTCVRCNKQPRMYESMGNKAKTIAGISGVWCHIECSPCNLKTVRMPTRQEAVFAWERINKVIAEAA